MLKWTASSQRLHELPQQDSRVSRRHRRERRATIANKENVPSGIVGYTSTPMPQLPQLARLRNSPLVLAPLSDIRNITPESSPQQLQPRVFVQSIHYATTLPRYEEEYSPSAGTLPTGQHLALRGLLPLDPFLEQPRYLKQRKLEEEFVATMEEEPVLPQPKILRPVTPQPSSTQMGDQTLDKLIDAILDSACKSDPSNRKKPRKSFNLRRRTLVKQQLESECQVTMLSPSYAAGDDPASDLSFTLCPLPATPEPASPMLPHSMLLKLPTPQLKLKSKPQTSHTDSFSLATPVRPLKRSRAQEKSEIGTIEKIEKIGTIKTIETIEKTESPLKRFKVDARNYFEVGLALPSSIYV